MLINRNQKKRIIRAWKRCKAQKEAYIVYRLVYFLKWNFLKSSGGLNIEKVLMNFQ